MSRNISVSITDDVADTLFIPLFMRKLETERRDGIINDPYACDLVEKIDYDFNKYLNARKSQLGTAIRIRHFDNVVSHFVERNDAPVVISVGAGLDTRFQRVYKGKGVFYELDLPEVIAFRRQLLPEARQNPHMACSMFDTEWITELVKRHPHSRFVIVAEGVFMYFPEDEIRPLLTAIAEGFPCGELHFDACSSWCVRNSHRHDAVKHSNATFHWALDSDVTVTEWTPYLRHENTTLFVNQERRRWGLMGVVAALIPRFQRMFRMLHYDIVPSE